MEFRRGRSSEDLELAYRSLRKDAASGVDEEDWTAYGIGLEGRLEQLHEAVQSGRYRPQPVLRQWALKPDGRKRPLGVTCVEDKIVQKALVWVLEAIYEVDFLGFSYGFRPGRSQHDALDAVYMAITTRKVSSKVSSNGHPGIGIFQQAVWSFSD